jgi:predicted small secreted protein
MAMKTIHKLLLCLVPVAAFVLSGCNTVEGFGKDVKTVGSKIERKAADERKN